jgi:AraC-like DNA-binding protein
VEAELDTSIPTIQVAATAGILELACSHGADPDSVVLAAGLTMAELARPEQRLPLRKFVTLIEVASRATGDDCFGVHLGQHCGLRELGLPGYLATFAPSVERALSSFARYYYLLGDATDVRFDRCGRSACFRYRVLDPASWPRRHDAESVLTMITVLIRQWIGPDWSPELVWLEHARPQTYRELERVLGCPMRFDCDTNAIWFELGSAAHANPQADERLFHLLSWFAERAMDRLDPALARPLGARTFREQVLDSIEACANMGNASIHSVSRVLALEARSLQRRLQADKTSFRELCEEYGQAQAIKLLKQSDLSETEIATRLGYASLNSFIRAFRRWYSVTPGQYRASQPRA